MSARDEVLALPEMLETILLALPMRDLLISQRTCKTWRALILQSLPIQRKLFFKPVGAVPLALSELEVDAPFEDTMVTRGWVDHLTAYNNAIYHPRGQGLSSDTNLEYMWIPSDSPARSMVEEEGTAKSRAIEVYLNPVLHALERTLTAAATCFVKSRTPLPTPWQRHEASWRKMQLTQPSTIAKRAALLAIDSSPSTSCRWPTEEDDKTPREWNFDSGCPQQLGLMVDAASATSRELWKSKGMGHSNCREPYRLELYLWGRQLWEELPNEGWQTDMNDDLRYSNKLFGW